LRYAPEERSRSQVVAGKRATEKLNTTTNVKQSKAWNTPQIK
jgi:hypothetical protein